MEVAQSTEAAEAAQSPAVAVAAAAAVEAPRPAAEGRMGCRAIALTTRSGRSAHWVKVKNPKAPAVKREAEQDWGRKR
jgi:hypothetical protein